MGNEAGKKKKEGAGAADFSLWDVNGFNLITGCSSQLVLISLPLSLHTRAFTGLSDYSQILQPVTNLQLTKCCRGIVSPLAPFHAPLTPFQEA